MTSRVLCTGCIRWSRWSQLPGLKTSIVPLAQTSTILLLLVLSLGTHISQFNRSKNIAFWFHPDQMKIMLSMLELGKLCSKHGREECVLDISGLNGAQLVSVDSLARLLCRILREGLCIEYDQDQLDFMNHILSDLSAPTQQQLKECVLHLRSLECVATPHNVLAWWIRNKGFQQQYSQEHRGMPYSSEQRESLYIQGRLSSVKQRADCAQEFDEIDGVKWLTSSDLRDWFSAKLASDLAMEYG
jgi:hypothetical protein